MSLAEELLKNFEHLIEAITLMPSDGGKFEVNVNGKAVFSKLQTQRHAEPGEIIGFVNKIIES